MADTIVSNHLKGVVGSAKKTGVLLSGGIDSTLITSYVLSYIPSALIFSMGTASTKDRPYVDIATSHFNHTYDWVMLDADTIARVVPTVRNLLRDAEVDTTLMHISLAAGYYLVFQYAASRGVKTIITGQGPDILFAGYHKYKGITSTEIETAILQDLKLLEIDKKRDTAMAKHFGITLINPYLTEQFVAFALTVPAQLKLVHGIEKYFMREWGASRNLPREIVERPKKAFQYSTGIQKVLQKIV